MQLTLRRMLACSLALFGTAALAHAQFPQQQPAQQPQQPAQQPQQPAQQPQAAPAQEVIAMVNGDAITQAELKAALDPQLQNGQADPNDPNAAEQLRQQVLKNLIESRLVEQYVIDEGPEVAEEEVDSVIDRYSQQVESQGIPFNEFLASSGYTKDVLEKRIQGSLAWQKYQQQAMTEENLQAHFQENQDRFPVPDFNQAREQVAQSFVSKLWKDIVTEKQPEADIRIVKPESPQAPNEAPPGTPPGFPQ